MPYVEVYLGAELVEAEVVPPSGLELFEHALGSAFEQLQRYVDRARRGQLAKLQRLKRYERRRKGEKRRAEEPRTSDAPSAVGAPSRRVGGAGAAQRRAAVLERFLAATRQSSQHAQRPPGRSYAAPMRGATGGRRKGMRMGRHG